MSTGADPAAAGGGSLRAAAVASPRRRAWRHRPDWGVLPPPEPRLEATIVVPVRNEAAGLPTSLEAMARQHDLDGRRLDPRRYEVIVLANNCSDESAAVVRRLAARRRSFRLHVVEVTFPRSVAHVGHARRVLMDEACRRLERGAGPRGVILSTDGDTRVTPDWLAANLREIAAGVDAVGGRIELDTGRSGVDGLDRLARRDAVYQRLRSRLEHTIDPDRADPWPRHHQHFGASLALTVAAYRRVGGLPPQRFLEDEALYRALRLHDLDIRHSRRVRVVTSSRREGRVDVGLSWQLREWASLAERAGPHADPLVPDPAHYATELRARRQLRDCWRTWRAASADPAGDGPGPAHARSRAEAGSGACHHALAAWATAWEADARWLEGRLRHSPTFGALWVEAGARFALQPPQPVPMREAIASLRRLIEASTV